MNLYEFDLQQKVGNTFKVSARSPTTLGLHGYIGGPTIATYEVKDNSYHCAWFYLSTYGEEASFRHTVGAWVKIRRNSNVFPVSTADVAAAIQQLGLQLAY
jgi:hypothetical protein